MKKGSLAQIYDPDCNDHRVIVQVLNYSIQNNMCWVQLIKVPEYCLLHWDEDKALEYLEALKQYFDDKKIKLLNQILGNNFVHAFPVPSSDLIPYFGIEKDVVYCGVN